MTGRELITVLHKHVTFPPGTASKRFVRDTAARPADYVLSERAERFAWRLAHIYRRQIPKAVAEEAARRKVDHQWEPAKEERWRTREKCAVCGIHMHSERERNRPCAGPPEPKTPPKRRSTAQGAVAVAKSPIDAPTLFETTSEIQEPSSAALTRERCP